MSLHIPSMRAHRPSALALAACGLLTCGLAFTGCTATAPPAPQTRTDAPREVPRYTIEQFLDVTSLAGASVSPDGRKVIFSSDASGIYNVYEVPVTGGPARALTDSADDALFVTSYFPDDERFLYRADEGGNELFHVYVRERDGSVVDVTPGEGHRAGFAGWAEDEQSFFVVTNERDEKVFDLYRVALTEGYPRERIYEAQEALSLSDVSPDQRYLAFGKTNTTSDADVYLYDRESGEMRHLTPHEGTAAFRAMGFTPDGRALLMTTDDQGEFARLVRYDLATGETETLLAPDWDVSYAYHSRGGKYLVVGINADARTDLRVYEAATLKPVPLPELPNAEITSVGISRDERLMTFYASSSRRPANLYVMGLGGQGPRAPRRLTDASSSSIDADKLVDGEVVRFDSYDGVEIPGILYKPRQAGPAAKAPALVYIHGGPGGQTRIGYSALIQYLVNHGYGVYGINNRGSSGYGKTFFRMDDQKHGEADLDDVVAAKGMLIDTGWVDPQRIGVIGGSYGGYLTLAAMTFRPEEFRAGVDLFGISNWVRTLESIPPWWEAIRAALYQEMGDPETSKDRLHRISPLFHAEQIVHPLMVLQGANDPRVLQVESDSIVEAARANGVPVEYVVFDDEGHGFVKKENREEGFRKIREFLDRYLKGDAV